MYINTEMNLKLVKIYLDPSKVYLNLRKRMFNSEVKLEEKIFLNQRIEILKIENLKERK